ncbi:MAG TPA: polymer-forming cytoskeletal protein [Candidatus Polarisedimenticolia bacterium]|nr:polymer-forming cytoskeletal protein [Candidatus Polarisedimenticolia bacterium]
MKGGFVMPFSKENTMRDPMGQEDISGFLAEGTEIKGEIRFKDLLRVDGKVSGKIVSEGELVIGETGEVEAEVSVGTLSVSGKVNGTVHAAEKVEIHPKGRVHGDMTIAKANLVIHEGGVFEGKIDMTASPRDNERFDDDHEARLAGVEPFRR